MSLSFVFLTPTRVCLILAAALLSLGAAHAENDAAYHTPSAAITALVDAPLTPTVVVSPDKKTLLFCERPSLPPVAELAQPELRLAGLRINPVVNGPSRDLYFTGLVMKHLEGGNETRIAGLPTDGRVGNVVWSSDSLHVAFTVASDHSVELWSPILPPQRHAG